MNSLITTEEFFNSDYELADSQKWRHGTRDQFHIVINGVDFLTEYIDNVSDDGLQFYKPNILLFEAEQVMVPKWKVKN